jgi:biotin carboxylase
VPVAAALASRLGLRGTPPGSALSARDKVAMRLAFAAAGVPQPRFVAIETFDDMARAANELGYPFVLKPTVGAHSRHIALVGGPDELETKYARVRDAVARETRFVFRSLARADATVPLIAEELLDGPQITTTTLVVGRDVVHLGLADVVSVRERGLAAFSLASRTTPSIVGAATARAVEATATRAIEALGLRDTAAHPELVLTAEGPKVLEVAARVGGFRAPMTKLAFGIDLDEAVLDLALGRAPAIDRTHESAATAVEVWPRTAGRVAGYGDVESLRARPDVHRLRIRRAEGTLYRPPPDDDVPCAELIVTGATPEEARAAAADVEARLAVRIVPA